MTSLFTTVTTGSVVERRWTAVYTIPNNTKFTPGVEGGKRPWGRVD